jgi:hydrogenase maturation factor
MMIMVHPEGKDQMEKELRSAGVPVACIGRICEREDGIRMVVGEEKIVIAPPASDELYKVIS